MAAAFVESPGRELLWVAAAVIDYGAPAVLGLGGFRVSPSYFVSRHGSIIIIALGEVVVELGGAARDLSRWEVITALVLGVAVMDEWQVADKRYLSEATLALLNTADKSQQNVATPAVLTA